MTKKSNVHPDHYKTDGRDRPDDAAAARLNRAIVAKAATQPRPDRMTKGLYFERPEPERPVTAGAKEGRAAKPTPPGAAPRRRSKATTASRRRAATGSKSRSAPARPKAARAGPPPPAKKR